MAIKFTFHGQRPKDSVTKNVDALGPQSGAAVSVANGAVSSALTNTGLYRVKATGAVTVLFQTGSAPANATGGEGWTDGEKEVRYLQAGTYVAVDAA